MTVVPQQCGHPRMPGVHCDGFHTYVPGWEGRQEHRFLYGHTPAPVPADTVEASVSELADPPASLKRGADGLTDQQRAVRRLHIAGMPHRDIGRELGITTNAVTTSIYRLRTTGRLVDRPTQEVTP